MLHRAYFPSSVKQKLDEDVKKLQPGDQTVQEYTREFIKLLNYAPFIAWDKAHKVYLYERGLRPEIFVLVQAQRLQALNASIEQHGGLSEEL